MAEIINYTMNFSCGRTAGLTFPRKLASSEMHCERPLSLVRGN